MNQIKTILCAIAMVFCATLPTTAAAQYACGTPLGSTNMQAEYQSWKNQYVTSNGAGGDLRVVRPQDSNDTVSEGIAYGMLLSAYLDDQATFDSLWSYAQQHFNRNGFMNWKIDSQNNVIGKGAATDAEEDMAIALIAAEKRWGGSYGAAATKMINTMMRTEVESGTNILKPGDGWGGSDVTNPSYYAPAYYEVYAEYTGDSRWLSVKSKSYELIQNYNNLSGQSNGLIPDWMQADGSPTNESWQKYKYSWDATRFPWRLGADYAWYCDDQAKSQLDKINTFFSGIGASNINSGYELDGRTFEQGHHAAFVGPVGAGAIASDDSAFKTALWNETSRLSNQGYYSDALRILTMLFMSGEFVNPLNLGSGTGSGIVEQPSPTDVPETATPEPTDTPEQTDVPEPTEIATTQPSLAPELDDVAEQQTIEAVLQMNSGSAPEALPTETPSLPNEDTEILLVSTDTPIVATSTPEPSIVEKSDLDETAEKIAEEQTIEAVLFMNGNDQELEDESQPASTDEAVEQTGDIVPVTESEEVAEIIVEQETQSADSATATESPQSSTPWKWIMMGVIIGNLLGLFVILRRRA